MTYQNIMIDRIKEMLMSVNCSNCPFYNFCDMERDKIEQCDKINEWLNEQYI